MMGSSGAVVPPSGRTVRVNVEVGEDTWRGTRPLPAWYPQRHLPVSFSSEKDQLTLEPPRTQISSLLNHSALTIL